MPHSLIHISSLVIMMLLELSSINIIYSISSNLSIGDFNDQNIQKNCITLLEGIVITEYTITSSCRYF